MPWLHSGKSQIRSIGSRRRLSSQVVDHHLGSHAVSAARAAEANQGGGAGDPSPL